jgi:hypothetical protein
MLPIRVGLVDKTKDHEFPVAELTPVASALTLQLQRDVMPIWGVNASVTALPDARHIPAGVWPLFIVDKLPPDEGGFHLTKNNQPYAKIVKGNTWTLDASHETIEMVIDPQGSRLHAANAIAVGHGGFTDAPGKFEYLVEACDPCEDQAFAYLVDDVLVSDFITPHFYDPVHASGVRYSFSGAITRPRQVLENGYLSWLNPAEGEVQQARFFDNTPQIVDLGPANGALRQFSDSKTRTVDRLVQTPPGHPKVRAREARAAALAAAAELRARRY